MNNVILLGLFLFTTSFGQNYSLEIEKIILNLTKLQWCYDYVTQKHAHWNQLSEKEYDAEAMIENYNLVKDYLDAPDSVQFSISKLFSLDQYDVYMCYNIGEHPETRYFIAYKESGKIFLLKNFWVDEMNLFIKDKYGFIEKAELKEIIELYDKIYYYSHYNKIIIDSANYKEYKNLGIEPFSIEVKDDIYNIEYFTIEPHTNALTQYNYQISFNGNIITQYKIIKDPDFSLE